MSLHCQQFPVRLEKKNLLCSYVAQGLLPGVFQKDIRCFTDTEADFYIECAERNRWRGDKRYHEYLVRTAQDIAPAVPEDIVRITELGKAGFLNRLSAETKLKLTHLSAKRLIWRCEMNKREGRYVSDKR